MSLFSISEEDLKTVELYRDFLPERIFDAHAHLHRADDIPTVYNPNGSFCRPIATAKEYRADMQPFFPGVKEFYLHAFPMPDKAMNDRASGLRDQANRHIVSAADADPHLVGSVYVMQGDTEREIAQMLDLPHIRGIKCYWFSTGKQHGDSCTVAEFLPEAAWEAANARALPIVLHMMHEQALSDERNLSYITAMSRRYPNAKLILAHCARAFASWTVIDQIQRLNDCENVWFDLAAICEPAPMMACIKHAPRRTLWGTDYPICLLPGKVISIGSGFHWLNDADKLEGVPHSHVIAESLLAFRHASSLLDLDRTQIDRIFFQNATELFGLRA